MTVGQITTLVAAFIGGGSIGAYLMRRALKARYDELDRQRQYSFEDRCSQLELLRLFLGKPSSNFTILMGAGNTYDEESRREMIEPIREWIESNKAVYPDAVQGALVTLGSIAGTMLTDEGLARMQGPQTIDMANSAWGVLKSYADRLENELTVGKRKTPS